MKYLIPAFLLIVSLQCLSSHPASPPSNLTLMPALFPVSLQCITLELKNEDAGDTKGI